MMGVSRGKTPELDSLAALLDLVKNPDSYQVKLNTLLQASADSQKWVEARAKLEDVDKLQGEAQEARDNADHQLAVAKTHATEIVEEAKQNALDILMDAHAKESAAQEKLSQANAFHESKTKEIDDREAKVKIEEDRLSRWEATLKERDEVVKAGMAKIERHKAVLAQLGD